ncbi:hypothetical protein JQK88_02910 [Mesorhizobium caraganae]|uniref:hypothetical protein n=1 Tax=Mesorhizobium caraganae TaxID=483206 RepID=UPI00193A4E64|nr:hypothetical protein [Mesorhizobium caraganae]MBM2710195.1 hypothetical protein [Mesorhizobium caraganae]
MNAFLRNTFLAAVAVSAKAGSAMADQTITCSNTQTNDWWAGRCCGAGDSGCLGHEGHGRDHHDNGGRGSTAGKN